MSEINTGGAAFPRPQAETSQGGNYEQDGMTLRDWFAGQALGGYVTRRDSDDYTYDAIAEWSYLAADAMLAAREVTK